MTDIIKAATAGTMESSDVYVEIEPCEQGIEIQLESVVLGQFGEAIDSAVRDVLAEQGITNANYLLHLSVWVGSFFILREFLPTLHFRCLPSLCDRVP